MPYRNLIQVIDDPGRAAGAGAMMGAGLSQGLNQSIAGLIQNKISNLRQQQERSQISQALQQAGYTPQEANLMSLYPQQMHPQMKDILLSREESAPQQPQVAPKMQSAIQNIQAIAPQTKPLAPLEQFNQNTQQQQKLQQQQLQQMQQQQQLQQLMQPSAIDRAVSQRVQALPPSPQQQPITPKIAPAKAIPTPVTPTTPKIAPKKVETPIPVEVMQKIEPSPIEVAKTQKSPGLTMAQQARERQAALKEATKAQAAINKEVKPYVDMLDKKGGAGAKVTDWTLNRMEKLIDSGKLTGSTMYNFRKRIESAGHIIGGGLGTALGAAAGGIAGSIFPGVGTAVGAGTGATIGGGIGAAAGSALAPKFVGSKEDQEFTKLSMNFLQNMKDIFGARVTQQEVSIFLDSIPTLAQTDEGKKAVIRDMKLISDGWRYRKQVKDKIVAANKGVMPANIEQLVEEASADHMDKLASQFAEGTSLKTVVA